MAGIELLPWQKERMRDWAAVAEGGAWVHRRVGESVPRQSGKSVGGIVWALFQICVLGYRVLWTDHNYATTCEMLRRFRDVLGERPQDQNARIPAFNKLVKRTSSKTAQEFFELSNGGLLVFSTRTKSATLGFTFDTVILDEAQELTDEQLQAILPTTSSGPHKNPQVLYLGTPTRAGSQAEKFQEFRADALAGNTDDACWCEYGIDDLKDAADEASWYKAHPSLGLTTTIEAIKLGGDGLSELAFAQEYLGYWLPRGAVALVSEQEWTACAIKPEDVPQEGRRCCGVKFSPDGAEVALAAAVQPPDGVPYVELMDIAPTSRGTKWLADWLLEHVRQISSVAIDGLAGAEVLIEKLVSGRAPKGFIARPTGRDMAAASSGMLEAIQTAQVAHASSPALDRSVLTSTRRQIGTSGGWGWSGEHAVGVEAASLALWALKTTKRDPTRKQVVW